LEGILLNSVHISENLRPQVLVLPIKAFVGVVVAGLPLKPTFRQHKVLGVLWIGLPCYGTLGYILPLVVGDEILGVIVLGLIHLRFFLRLG